MEMSDDFTESGYEIILFSTGGPGICRSVLFKHLLKELKHERNGSSQKLLVTSHAWTEVVFHALAIISAAGLQENKITSASEWSQTKDLSRS